MKEKFYKKYFENKKVTLVGLGGFGRALKEAQFLAKNGADLIITDLSPEQDLKKEMRVLEKYKNIKYTLGEHKAEDFRGRDLVFYANGIPLKNKYIKEAKKSSKVVTKSVAYLFYILEKEFGEKIKKIGVTGTKGKSTVSQMAIFLLENFIEDMGKKNLSADKIQYPTVFSAGNIRGSSNLPILEKIKEEDFLVAELDSWLLQGFGDLKISPEFSIFTNFFTDHQNYYHSMKKYFKDKSFIFKFQGKNDFLIFPSEGKKEIKKYFDWEKIKSKKVFSNFKKNPNWKIKVFGIHNQKNISLVLSLAEILKIPKKIQKKTFEEFGAVEGRMQFLGEKKNILFFNDNNSTTPDSTILNIEALKEKYPSKNIYLIGGGADKDFKFKKLSENIQKKVQYAIFFEGVASEEIIKNFGKTFSNFSKSESMKFSFDRVMEKIKKDEGEKKSIIVLSPGAASFGVFKNEYDRNDQFLKLFKKL
jgi:UDP-N-acetylmuramoylalanine--D-glutamate ligase